MTKSSNTTAATPVEALVLRKFDYSETSLIFVVLTHHQGQQHFIMKGVRKGGKTRFPAVDLFRHVQITCNLKPGRDLHTIRDAELIEHFDSIATHPMNYRAAGWLCKLSEKTTVPEEPCEQQFIALKCALNRLKNPCQSVYPICISYMFTCLSEHGLLPDLSGIGHQAEAMSYLLAYATDETLDPPAYTIEQWQDLFFWAVSYFKSVDLPIPDYSKLK